MTLLEVCVDNLPDLEIAIDHGADRIELCAALAVGGLTPSPGLIAAAATAPRPIHVLIRPRQGDFHYEVRECALVSDDIARAIDLGASGVVIGAGGAGGLDQAILEKWIRRSRASSKDAAVTLHRIFDLCSNLPGALDQAIALGFDRVLTSGGERCAADAVSVLARLHRQAAGRITVMAGSGLNAKNVGAIVAAGIEEVHASCGAPSEEDEVLVRLGFVAPDARRVSGERVRALRQALDALRPNDA